MKWALVALALFWGCSSPAAVQRNADGIHVDERAQRAYYAWLEAGEPRLDSSQLAKHHLEGGASWYGEPFHGRRTASGEFFDMYTMTAAHKTLPFGTVVRVTRPDTRQFVVVRINDRGPFVEGRIIDLAYGAAHDLDMIRSGVVEVELEVIAWGDGKYRKE